VAEAATVEVDTETGQVHILDVVCADDVGKAINPDLVKGQIEGAVVQAAGYAILEDFVQKDGYVQSAHFSTYLIPGILDVPDTVHSVIVEYPDPRGPWGARGMAEMPFIPLAASLTAAMQHAVGVWFHAFPLTPERVLSGLRSLKSK
jgi:CO/xanthine dehydrogenase Mo-binding subunit